MATVKKTAAIDDLFDEDLLTEPEAETPPPPGAPQSWEFWLPGPAPMYPQPTLMVPGSKEVIKFRDGKAVVYKAEHADLIRKRIRHAYEADLKTPFRMAQMGYAPRSQKAAELHQKLLEGGR